MDGEEVGKMMIMFYEGAAETVSSLLKIHKIYRALSMEVSSTGGEADLHKQLCPLRIPREDPILPRVSSIHYRLTLGIDRADTSFFYLLVDHDALNDRSL
jgi:hypothetical protein